MIGALGRFAIRLVHEVVTEWRDLERPAEPGHPELSCTSASTERAAAWDHDKRPPAVAARERPFGIGKLS